MAIVLSAEQTILWMQFGTRLLQTFEPGIDADGGAVKGQLAAT